MTSKRHWQPSDFVVTKVGSGYGGGIGTDWQYGYCRVCFGDMHQLGGDARLQHYNSHGTAAKLGLWGKKRK